MLNSSSENFRKAFLIQYPSKGIWVIGLQSGDYKAQAQEIIGEEIINLFVPTTPNPTSGFLLFVPTKDIIRLSMNIEEGMKLVISGGIITPKYLKRDKNTSRLK